MVSNPLFYYFLIGLISLVFRLFGGSWNSIFCYLGGLFPLFYAFLGALEPVFIGFFWINFTHFSRFCLSKISTVFSKFSLIFLVLGLCFPFFELLFALNYEIKPNFTSISQRNISSYFLMFSTHKNRFLFIEYFFLFLFGQDIRP